MEFRRDIMQPDNRAAEGLDVPGGAHLLRSVGGIVAQRDDLVEDAQNHWRPVWSHFDERRERRSEFPPGVDVVGAREYVIATSDYASGVLSELEERHG